MYKEYLINLKLENISKHRDQEKLASLINKKKIRYHFNRLIREYNILPEERKPLIVVKHVTKTLFWATVYLAFSYLTISSSFKVIQQYRDDEVTTNMKAVINNNVTYLPNMTICFKINTSELFDISSSSGFNYTSAWSQFFEETTLEGTFKVNESQIYDDEIYLSLLKYLAMIYEAERAWEPGLRQISTFHSKKSDDWIALKEFLVPNIERFNITLEQLKRVFDGKFCSLPAGSEQNYLLGFAYGMSGEKECIAGSKISFIGMDAICFRLIGYRNYLRSLGRTELIYLELYDDGRISYDPDVKNQKWCQGLTIDVGSESRSAPRRVTLQNETYSYYYNHFTGIASIYMDIGVKALYRKLPYVKGDVQCSSDTSLEECENKCLRGWIRANCHCSPITFNLTADISSYRNCTADDYSICLKKYTENVTYLCTNKCVALCEQWHYEYGFQSNSVTPSRVEIRLKTFDYVIIEQVFMWNSFEEFIGALGGALGIWLGLDFVIIIEFIVKLVAKLIKKILLRKGHNSEEDKHRKSANVKHREENVENGMSSSNETGRRVAGHRKKYNKNENEIGGTSIRQVNESEKQRTSRKKRESNAVKENHEQQRRKCSNNNRADSSISDEKAKHIDVYGGHQRNRKVNITDNVNAVHDASSAHANKFSVRSWFLQKITLLVLNDKASAKKPDLFLQIAEKLFWAAIYFVGSVITTLWCVKLINLYLADKAVYFPSLFTNGTVSVPPPSLCFYYYENSLFFEGRGSISNALLGYFGRSDIDRATFIQISNGEVWPKRLVAMGLFYIATFAASEIKYNNISFIAEYERQLNLKAGEDIILRKDINKSLNDILLPKLLEWNITANELRQRLGAEVARMVKLKITLTNRKGTTDFVNETSFYTAAITEDMFCYSLSSAVNFTDPDDVLEFSISKALDRDLFQYWLPNYIFLSDYLLEPEGADDFFTEDSSSVAVFDSTYFKFVYGEIATIFISTDGLYTSRPEANSVKHCSPETTTLYCRAQCRIELIESLCNCSPTYWTMMIPPTSGLDECTFDRYMGCLNFNAKDDLNCKDSCLPSCTATYFRSDRSKEEFRKYSDMDYAVIRFGVNDGTYVSIEERPIFTFPDMLIKV